MTPTLRKQNRGKKGKQKQKEKKFWLLLKETLIEITTNNTPFPALTEPKHWSKGKHEIKTSGNPQWSKSFNVFLHPNSKLEVPVRKDRKKLYQNWNWSQVWEGTVCLRQALMTKELLNWTKRKTDLEHQQILHACNLFSYACRKETESPEWWEQ